MFIYPLEWHIPFCNLTNLVKKLAFIMVALTKFDPLLINVISTVSIYNIYDL